MIKKPNYTEPWSIIHQSGLFKPKRCNFCKLAESTDADVSVGDPWLEEYKDDAIGHTLFLTHSQNGVQVIQNMQENNVIVAKAVDYSQFEISQKPNVEKSQKIKKNKKATEQSLKLVKNKEYHNWATKNILNMRRHIKITRLIEHIYHIKEMRIKGGVGVIARKVLKKIKSGGGKTVLEKTSRWTG